MLVVHPSGTCQEVSWPYSYLSNLIPCVKQGLYPINVREWVSESSVPCIHVSAKTTARICPKFSHKVAIVRANDWLVLFFLTPCYFFNNYLALFQIYLPLSQHGRQRQQQTTYSVICLQYVMFHGTTLQFSEIRSRSMSVWAHWSLFFSSGSRQWHQQTM